MLEADPDDTETDVDAEERLITVLGYGADDVWYFLGEPTRSPELVFAALLLLIANVGDC